MRAKLIFICSIIASSTAFAGQTLSVQSAFGVDATADRLEKVLRENGVSVVERTRGQGKQNGRKDEETIVFDNPVIPTYDGRCRWSDTHHKPLQAHIYRDANGAVWLAFDLPEDKMNAFGVIECGTAKRDMERILNRFATGAAGL